MTDIERNRWTVVDHENNRKLLKYPTGFAVMQANHPEYAILKKLDTTWDQDGYKNLDRPVILTDSKADDSDEPMALLMQRE